MLNLNISVAQNIFNGSQRGNAPESNAIQDAASPKFTDEELVVLAVSTVGILCAGIGLIGIGVVLANRYFKVYPELKEQQAEIGCKIACATIEDNIIKFSGGNIEITCTEKDMGDGTKVYVKSGGGNELPHPSIHTLKDLQNFYRNDVVNHKELYIENWGTLKNEGDALDKAIHISALARIGTPDFNENDITHLMDKYQIQHDNFTAIGLTMCSQLSEDVMQDIVSTKDFVTYSWHGFENCAFIPQGLAAVLDQARLIDTLCKVGRKTFTQEDMTIFEGAFDLRNTEIDIDTIRKWSPLSEVEIRFLSCKQTDGKKLRLTEFREDLVLRKSNGKVRTVLPDFDNSDLLIPERLAVVLNQARLIDTLCEVGGKTFTEEDMTIFEGAFDLQNTEIDIDTIRKWSPLSEVEIRFLSCKQTDGKKLSLTEFKEYLLLKRSNIKVQACLPDFNNKSLGYTHAEQYELDWHRTFSVFVQIMPPIVEGHQNTDGVISELQSIVDVKCELSESHKTLPTILANTVRLLTDQNYQSLFGMAIEFELLESFNILEKTEEGGENEVGLIIIPNDYEINHTIKLELIQSKGKSTLIHTEASFTFTKDFFDDISNGTAMQGAIFGVESAVISKVRWLESPNELNDKMQKIINKNKANQLLKNNEEDESI